MNIEKTETNMYYSWELTNKKIEITLFPVKGRHNYDAIRRTKKEIRSDYDIVFMDVQWISILDEKKLIKEKNKVNIKAQF